MGHFWIVYFFIGWVNFFVFFPHNVCNLIYFFNTDCVIMIAYSKQSVLFENKGKV